MTIERSIRILEMVDSAPGMVSDAKAMAIRSLKAWEMLKDDAESHIKAVKCNNPHAQRFYTLGERHIIDLIDNAIGEVGETDGYRAKHKSNY